MPLVLWHPSEAASSRRRLPVNIPRLQAGETLFQRTLVGWDRTSASRRSRTASKYYLPLTAATLKLRR